MYIKAIDYNSAYVAKEFSTSLRETGFAMLKNHPLSQKLLETVYQDWEEFFNNTAKFNYLFSPDEIPQRGYFPLGSENAKDHSVKDLKEYYHYSYKKNLPEGMGQSTQLLLENMLTLGLEVLGWIETALPKDIAGTLSIPLHQMIDRDASVLRILHYPPVSENIEDNAVRAAAHEDINLITILPAATTSGLQVLDRLGKWHDVSCDQGGLIFNGGDMLQEATRGYYRSTTHKVLNPVGELAKKSRYSVPLFVHPRNDVRLSETYTVESYFAERFKENGLKSIAQAA